MIEKIKEYLVENNLDAAIINDNDPHISEYIEDYYKFRNVLSGFSGSAGFVVCLKDEASLYTDGRYYIQAERELIDGIKLKKGAEPTEIKYYDYILNKGNRVALDFSLFSTSEIKMLEEKGLIVVDKDFTYLWENRPNRNITSMYLLKDYVDSFDDKLAKLREVMAQNNVDTYVTAKLDSISYLLNLRSNDIKCNPSITAYLIVEKDRVVLFTDNFITSEIKDYLTARQVLVLAYSDIYTYLQDNDFRGTLALDYGFTNYKIYNLLNQKERLTILNQKDYLFMMKSLKSEKEITGLRKAHELDAISLLEFFSDCLSEESDYTEADLNDLVVKYRKMHPSYLEDSFNPICASGANAAMMHYSAKKGSSFKIKEHAMLLVDTGGHYLEGTTDITRTFLVNKALVTAEMKKCFTLTLKGLIDLTMTKFLDKCTGGHLDAICRSPLWSIGLDYKCGTGHGVGHILNVHEGPRNFSISNQEYKLEKGAYLTIEPGVYLADKFGIRIENNVVVSDYLDYGLDHFYEFDTLTLVPIDINLIDKTYLNQAEVDWLNNYHQKVYETLKDQLSPKALAFLKEYTKAI